MSALGALAVGFGIGLVVAFPALFVFRRDIANNVRGALGLKEIHVSTRIGEDGKIEQKLPSGVVIFGIGAGSITALYGVLTQQAVFLVSGLLAIASICLTLIVHRAVITKK